MDNYYMVTIKRNAVDYTPAHEVIAKYRDVVQGVRRAYWASDAWLELDRMERIHLHTWFRSKRKPNYRKFTSSGWTVHFDPFTEEDFITVASYCGKDNMSIKDEEAVEWIDTYSWAFWRYILNVVPKKCEYQFPDEKLKKVRDQLPQFIGIS